MNRADPRDAPARPIGVFDSGIGGLTVVRHIHRLLPDERVVYFGDSARVPYGTKSPETVIRFSMESARFLLRRDVKFLVVACNTSSAVAMPTLDGTFEIPKVGVIGPAVRRALEATRSGRVGVIGTGATIASGAYAGGLKAARSGVVVVSRACPLLVPLVEDGWLEGEIPESLVKHYLDPVLSEGVDVIILGCTHYPLLKDLMAKAAGDGVTLVESGEAAAEDMARTLASTGLLRRRDDPPLADAYYVSDIPMRFREIGERFLGKALESVERVDQVDLPWYDR